MRILKQIILNFILLFLLTSLNLFAQQTAVSEVTMADQLRSDGKIWVVVAVIATVFAGIIIYLINLDSKISKIEKEMKK